MFECQKHAGKRVKVCTDCVLLDLHRFPVWKKTKEILPKSDLVVMYAITHTIHVWYISLHLP